MTRASAVLIVFSLLTAGPGSKAPLVYAQQRIANGGTQPVPTTLEPSSSKVLQVPPFGSYGNAQCDSNGNLYFHLDSQGYSGSLIMKLTPSTETPTLFHLPGEFASKMSFMDFSITPDASLAMLEQSTDGIFIFHFDEDGSMKEKTKLETPEHLVPDHFAMADNGVIFLNGHFFSDAPMSLRGKGYAALFEPSGKVRKDLRGSAEDVDLKSKSTALQSGAAAVSEDGTFYFLRSKDIIIISQSGTLRRISFTNPDLAQTATDIKLSGALMSVDLRKSDAAGQLSWSSLVLNESTGEVYGYYKATKEAGVNDACFLGRDGYTFQTIEDGKVKLVSVPLR